MLDARFSHLYFYQSLNRLQRGLSAIAELLVLLCSCVQQCGDECHSGMQGYPQRKKLIRFMYIHESSWRRGGGGGLNPNLPPVASHLSKQLHGITAQATHDCAYCFHDCVP